MRTWREHYSGGLFEKKKSHTVRHVCGVISQINQSNKMRGDRTERRPHRDVAGLRHHRSHVDLQTVNIRKIVRSWGKSSRRWRMFSVWAPWSGLIASGLKPCENRPESVATTAPFKPGSILAVHESKSKAQVGDQTCADRLKVAVEVLNGKKSPNKGKIVAIGRVLTVTSYEQSIKRWPEHARWCDEGKFQIMWDVMVRLDEPIKVTGGQGAPWLSDAKAKHKNAKGETKTTQQIERAEKIALERRQAAELINEALESGKFTVTRGAK